MVQKNAVVKLPSALTKLGELVIVSRKDYDALMKRSMKQTGPKLPLALQQALKEVRAGRTFGPFASAEDLMKALEQ